MKLLISLLFILLLSIASNIFGLLWLTVAILLLGLLLVVDTIHKSIAPGWTSNIVSTVFLSGIQLIVLGIIGEYLGKLFIENKRRPNYIIEKTDIKNRVNEKHEELLRRATQRTAEPRRVK